MAEKDEQFEQAARTRLVKDQARVIAYLATQIAEVFQEFASIPDDAKLIWDVMASDHKGREMYELMNSLGDVLNALDAVDEDAPVFVDATFEQARETYKHEAGEAGKGGVVC